MGFSTQMRTVLRPQLRDISNNGRLMHFKVRAKVETRPSADRLPPTPDGKYVTTLVTGPMGKECFVYTKYCDVFEKCDVNDSACLFTLDLAMMIRGTFKEWTHTPVGFIHDIQQNPNRKTKGLIFQTKHYSWAIASLLTPHWWSSDEKNPLRDKCTLATKAPYFCLQGMQLHWLTDGPLPMRMMGATQYDSGGRCYVGNGGDGSDKGDGTDTGPYGTMSIACHNQPYPQDMLEAALMYAAAGIRW